MSEPTIPVPAELAGKLPTGPAGLALVGPDGQPVGYVVSPAEYRALRDAMTRSFFLPPTTEELDRADAEGGEHTMEEVFALLGGPSCGG